MSKHSKIVYTDVIVIGNGPSGISLSYLLAGNWPYYTGEIHPNEYLQLRLQDGGDASLVEQDLEYLSSGLEGRSSNPIALLLDTLTHPDADIGMEVPSILEWRHLPDKAIDHVVLGKMPVGGAWQMMEGSMQTLSLGNWMQLPDLPFKDWLRNYRQKVEAHHQGDESPRKANRASIEEVKNYYTEYVNIKGIKKYFRERTTVTTVERVLDVHHRVDDESGEQVPCTNDHCGKFKWEVRGQETTRDQDGSETTTDFCYRAPNVVIATGTYDAPNRLKVPGEQQPYVMHSMGELERLVRAGQLRSDSHPVLIIGAGLSAADAVLYSQENCIPVAHMFRRDVNDPHIIFRSLPSVLFPEYQHVHAMMAAREPVDGYEAFPMHSVVEFKDDNKVLIRKQRKGTCDTILEVSCVLVQIGSRPSLSFLPHCGRHIGVVPGMHIDSKHNPIDIDPYTYQSIHEHGLFAMGPLVGDNFVRFLRGGALAITSHLHRKRCHQL